MKRLCGTNRPRFSRSALRARARPARTLCPLRRKARRHRAQTATVGAFVTAISLSAGSGRETVGATSELGDEAGRGSKRSSKRRSGVGMALMVRWILRWPSVEKKTPRDSETAGRRKFPRAFLDHAARGAHWWRCYERSQTESDAPCKPTAESILSEALARGDNFHLFTGPDARRGGRFRSSGFAVSRLAADRRANFRAFNSG
jgi:hypothetical protein